MMFDPLYMMILVVTLVLSGAVSLLVKTRFAAGQKVNISSGLSGADVAKAILMEAGITDVKVLKHQGFLVATQVPQVLPHTKSGMRFNMLRDTSRCGSARRLFRLQISVRISDRGL